MPVGEMDTGTDRTGVDAHRGAGLDGTLVCSRSSRPVNWSARLATSLCASWLCVLGSSREAGSQVRLGGG